MANPKEQATQRLETEAPKVEHAFNLKMTLFCKGGSSRILTVSPASTQKLKRGMPPHRNPCRVLVERFDGDCAMEHGWLIAEQWQKLLQIGNLRSCCRSVFSGNDLVTAFTPFGIKMKLTGEGGCLDIPFQIIDSMFDQREDKARHRRRKSNS